MVGGYLPKTQVPLIWGIPSNDIHLGLGFRFLVIFIVSFLLALWQQLFVNKFIEYGHYICFFFESFPLNVRRFKLLIFYVLIINAVYWQWDLWSPPFCLKVRCVKKRQVISAFCTLAFFVRCLQFAIWNRCILGFVSFCNFVALCFGSTLLVYWLLTILCLQQNKAWNKVCEALDLCFIFIYGHL
jgi:hypothetical protein